MPLANLSGTRPPSAACALTAAYTITAAYTTTAACALTCLLMAASACPAAEVSGVVLNSHHQPIPRATILWEPASFANLHGRQHAELSQTKTAADGTFNLRVSPSEWQCPSLKALDGAIAFARISAPGYGLWDGTLAAGANRPILTDEFVASGTVEDENGHALPGVRVRYAGPNPDIGHPRFGDYDLSEVTTVSDNQGDWRLEGLPADSTAFVEIDDPRYVSTPLTVTWGLAARLVARPGATLTGRILAPDGHPVAGLTVTQGPDLTHPGLARRSVTGTDGRFNFTGLAPGPCRLSLMDPQSQWFAEPLTVPALTGGATVTAPDWTATPGVTVTARIVRAGNNTPIPGAGMEVDGSAMSLGVADTKGIVLLHVPSGGGSVTFFGPDESYVNLTQPLVVPVGATKIALGDVALAPGLMLTGTAVGPDGGPAAGAMLMATADSATSTVLGKVNEQGQFALGPVPFRAKFTIQLQDDEEWELPAPISVVTPASVTSAMVTSAMVTSAMVTSAVGTPFKPLHIVLQVPKFTPITGKVMDDHRRRLAGVVVNVLIVRTQGGVWPVSAVTDDEGIFVVPRVHDVLSARVQSLTRDGYATQTLGSTASPSKVDPLTGDFINDVAATDFSDSVMISLEGKITGEVAGPDERPVAGAMVMALPPAGTPDTQGVPLPFPVTGEDGRFIADALPNAQFNLFAAQGKLFGETTAESREDLRVELRPATPSAASTRTDLIQSFSPDDFWFLISYWDYLGEDKIGDLALRIDGAIGADGSQHDQLAGKAFAMWLGELAQRDPRRAAQLGPALLARYDPGLKQSDLRAVIAGACAMAGDATARQWASDWVNSQKKLTARLDPPTDVAGPLFRAAGVAGALHRPDAEGFLDLALTAADQEGKDAEFQNSQIWGRSLAIGGLETLHHLDGEFTPTTRCYIWAATVPVLAEQDAKSAETAVAVVYQLQGDPNPLVGATPWNWDKMSPIERYATGDLLKTEARTGAPELLPEVAGAPVWIAEPVHEELTLAALAKRDMATATAAMRAGAAAVSGSPLRGTYYASVAATFNPALSEDLFLHSGPVAAIYQDQNFPDMTMPNYAYYHGFIDPAKSRLLLETILQPGTTRESGGGNPDMIKDLTKGIRLNAAAALFPLDPSRALELLNQLPDANRAKAQAEARVIAMMESDPARWPLLPAR